MLESVVDTYPVKVLRVGRTNSIGEYMYSKSKTDSRIIYDFAMPGVKDKDIGIFVRKDSWGGECGCDNGHDFTVKVRGKPDDKFGFNKQVVTKYDETIQVSEEFDLEKLSWNYANGVLRVSIPKMPFAVGTKVEASAPVAPDAPETD